jgi:hypothetical protein
MSNRFAAPDGQRRIKLRGLDFFADGLVDRIAACALERDMQRKQAIRTGYSMPLSSQTAAPGRSETEVSETTGMTDRIFVVARLEIKSGRWTTAFEVDQ